MTSATMNRLRAAAALVLVLTTGAAGCTGNLLKSGEPAPDTFRLGATEAAAAAAPPFAMHGLAIVVSRPRASAALDTDRIAVVAAGSRFDYYAGARWAESAPQMVQESLVAALAGAGQFTGGVFAAPARVPAELLLDVELRRFESVAAGTDASASSAAPVVHVQVQASLVDTRRGQRVTSFVSEAVVPASANRLQDVIAAYASANARVAADVARRVQDAAATLPAK